MDLEELAFKNVNELTKLSKEELLMIIALLQQDRKCWIQQFTKTHNDSVDIRSRIDKAIELLIEDIDFLENDSVGKYYVCDESVYREKKALEILKGGSNG